MKFNYLIKLTPFFITLLLILFIGNTNRTENTKLRILIWSTPTLTLGSYLSISAGSGFILSYLITSNISRINKKNTIKLLKYKDENYEDGEEYFQENDKLTYDKTLIERDIKDPTPTVNANFRIISKTKNIDSYYSNNIKYDDSYNYEDDNDQRPNKQENYKDLRSFSNDWNDDSFSSW